MKVIRSAWEKDIGVDMLNVSVGAEGCMMTSIEVSLLALFSASASKLSMLFFIVTHSTVTS